jgi:hypothetical protein
MPKTFTLSDPETIGRQPTISATVFRLDCQHVTNQRRPADRDREYQHAVHHRFAGSERQVTPVRRQKRPLQPLFVAECGNAVH